MPVVKVSRLFMQGRTVQDEVIRRVRQDRIHAPEGFPEDRSQEFELGALAFLEVACMAFRQDPHFKGKPRGVGRDAEKFRIFQNDPRPFRRFLPQDIAIDAAFFLLEVLPAAVDFLQHARRDHWKSDELRMAVFQGRARRRAMVLKDEDVA